MTPNRPRILFLVGPTAVGKSKLAIELAKRLDGEIVSADSMQIYKGMDIGTAKPSRSQLRQVPHHLIDITSASQTFSVFQYRKRALKKINEVIACGKMPIVVGGSGLYVRALLEGLSEPPGPDFSLRRQFQKEAEMNGPSFLYQKLLKRDPEAAKKINPHDIKRIIRALEIVQHSGKKKSEWTAQKQSLSDLGFEPIVIGVTKDRNLLYQDIEKRVDQMFRKGFVREVKRLSKMRVSKTAAQAVGYREILQVLRCQTPVSDIKSLIKRNTRRLAKRQMTWFRKEKGIHWVLWKPTDTVASICESIQNIISL